MYIAYFQWAGYDENLCCGTNKKKVKKYAYDKARIIYGTGPVNRGAAMCSSKITMNDIGIDEIEII